MANPYDVELSAAYLADEALVLKRLNAALALSDCQRQSIETRATGLVAKLRRHDQHIPLIDTFLLEYGLSTHEGVVLMRLAEALLRTPDRATRNRLMRDRLVAGDWKAHAGCADSKLVNLTTFGLRVAKAWIAASGDVEGRSLIARMGDRMLGMGVNRAMVIMGEHFVLGKTIDAAIRKSRKLHKDGFHFSYDMLGEAAMTEADAERYFQAYLRAVKALANSGETFGDLSVKLSALHPRYELAQANICVPVLTQRVKQLALICKAGGFGLAIDAEEAERLEISLHVIGNLIADPDLEGWDGLSVVVQAYQRRAMPVLQWLVHEAQAQNRKLCIRLVKGAYWDSEIKRAQEMGLSDYPVFTRKENTDISYLACARFLFENLDTVFPQFATHNAHTAAAILEMAPAQSEGNTEYEFQCLHGMGEALHRTLVTDHNCRSRIYAPVGQHADLLPYLVRRLLENGANSSFVNQLVDPDIEIADIIRDPQDRVATNSTVANPAIPFPRDYFSGTRLAAKGLDLTQVRNLQEVEGWFDVKTEYTVGNAKRKKFTVLHNPAKTEDVVGRAYISTITDVTKAVASAKASNWAKKPTSVRARILRDVALRLEEETPILLPLIVREAGKSLNDAVAEISEAVDFCRYYANQCEDKAFATQRPLGIMACISPWNFPLAIFIGQVAAALAAGNTVVAKPAEQTPLIAAACMRILHRAGVPKTALHLVLGGGDIGAALVAELDVAGVCFTGSTATAKKIAATLANTGRGMAPLIAETGGINAMIIDSTALLEQAVGDVVASAFQSAGQRCSACRLVCIQDDVADSFVEMLSGAMAMLLLGDPSDPATDVGPVIDQAAAHMLRTYIDDLRIGEKQIAETPKLSSEISDLFIAPIAFEIESIGSLTREIFGPVLHVVRFKGAAFEQVIENVNALGYGLTMGLHTRMDTRVEGVAQAAKVGNLYVNRNQIGAVVGVQPFGGEGLSGTGPKAGGPHYLYQMSRADKEVTRSKLSGGQVALTPVPITEEQLAVLEKSKTAQRIWQNMNRSDILRATASVVDDEHLSKTLLHAAELVPSLFDEVTELPGPTGELNTLRLVARGVMVGMAGKTVSRGLSLALAAGNSVCVEGEFTEFTKALERAGAPKNLLTCLPLGTANSFIDADIDGLIVPVETAEPIAAYARHRAGKILPVLYYHDAPERFVIERTCTIDTTAAGGNASLLASV